MHMRISLKNWWKYGYTAARQDHVAQWELYDDMTCPSSHPGHVENLLGLLVARWKGLN